MDVTISSGALGIDMHNDHAQSVTIKSAIGDFYIIKEDEDDGTLRITKVGDAPKHMIVFPISGNIVDIA